MTVTFRSAAKDEEFVRLAKSGTQYVRSGASSSWVQAPGAWPDDGVPVTCGVQHRERAGLLPNRAVAVVGIA